MFFWPVSGLIISFAINDVDTGVLSKHHPQIMTCIPQKITLQDILTPPLDISQVQALSDRELLEESCRELSEWLALVSLNSPRVHTDDSIDPYLSRYVVPRHCDAKSSNFVKISWKGLIPPVWITQLLVTIL
jgi:ribonuclease P/MRP protein subunit RPP40